jgi:hypothetical protein
LTPPTDQYPLDLEPFATERQAEYLRALHEVGTLLGAAEKVGVARQVLTAALGQLKVKAALRGYSPEHRYTNIVPATHVAKGVSTLHDADGNVKLQWVKSSLSDQAQAEAIKAAAQAFADELPRLPPLPSPTQTAARLVNVYTLTDCHVGMLSWPRETGEAWDLDIAERTLAGSFERLISAAPPAETCYINQLGDFLHSDGMQAVTPTSGHLLDQDGRFAKVVRVAIRVLRRVVDMALQRHVKVHVLLAEGNHDLASSIWLRAMFSALYEGESRVAVVDSEFPYYAHRHGSTMLAFHHGHLKKNEQLPGLFAAAFARMWGETEHRYCHTGHRHHLDEKEHSGMTVLQHPTLAAKDAYAARGGWFAARRAIAVTYHDRYGEVGRVTVTPEMLA